MAESNPEANVPFIELDQIDRALGIIAVGSFLAEVFTTSPLPIYVAATSIALLLYKNRKN